MFDCRWFKSSFRVMAAVLSLALLCGAMPFVPVSAADEVVFGVLSDVHLTKASTDWERQARFEMALEYYKERGAKVIVANADINDLGEAEAYDKFMAIWDKVFPDPAAAPKLLVTGDNHEWYGAWNFREAGTSANNTTIEVKQQMFMDGLRLTSTNNATVVDGYHFIAFSSDGFQPNTSNPYYSDETVAWVSAQLATAAAESSTRPIYVFMHQPPANTVVWAEANYQLLSLFAQYPQIVMFTSHTHADLMDERNIYQKDYTIVNTSAVYQNSQATIATVSGNTTTVRRLRLDENKGVSTLKYDWVIENPSDKSGYVYTPENYAAAAIAPQFPSGATAVASALGNNRFLLSFTAAEAQADNGPSDFVFSYSIVVKKDGVTLTTANVKSDFSMGDTADCYSSVIDLPGNMTVGASYDVVITPQDCYGNAGAPITTTYTHAYKSDAKMVAISQKFDDAGEVSASGTSTGFSITVDQDTMPTVDAVDLSWDYHLIGVAGEGGVYLNGVAMENILLYKSWQNRFKVHLPSATYQIGDVITVRGWFRPENLSEWPTGYSANWRAYFMESSYQFVGDRWVQVLYNESCMAGNHVTLIEQPELAIHEATGLTPLLETRHHYALANDVLPLGAELTPVYDGVFVNGALDTKATLRKDGAGKYAVILSETPASGTRLTVNGLFVYEGYYIRFAETSFVYDAATDTWDYASDADRPAEAPSIDEQATNGELSVSDATVLMGGSYGAGAYYEVQANFSAANWIVNATPTDGKITLEYYVNGESRTNATSTFGVAYLTALASNYVTPFGGTNFIANSGNNTTFYSQKQVAHITLTLDPATFVPMVNGAAVGPHVNSEWSRYHDGETVDSSSVAAFFEDLNGKGAQYFGLGWNGGNFSADYAKLMIYDENNNDLGVQSHATGRELWNAVLKADYDSVVYLRPTVKAGQEVVGLRFTDEDGGELEIEANDEGNGVWSFVMTSDIYGVSPIYDTPSTKVNFSLMLPDSQWQPAFNRYLIYFEHDLGSELSFAYGKYDVITIDGVKKSVTCSTTGAGGLLVILNDDVGITSLGEHEVVLRGGTRIGDYTIAEDIVFYTHTANPTVDKTPPAATEFTVLGLGYHAGPQDDFERFLAGLDTDVAYTGEQTSLTVDVNGTSQTFSLFKETGAEDGIAQPTLLIPYDLCPKGIAHTLTVKAGTVLEGTTLTEDFTFYIHADGLVTLVAPKEPEYAELKGSQVTLGDDLTVDYTLSLDDSLDVSSVTVKITYSGYSKTSTLGEADGNGYYHFCVDVPAKDIASVITITVFDGSKEILSKTHSVRAYGEAILNGNYTDTEKTAAKAMLNYGAAAQTYFGYNVSDLANENCAYTSEQLNAADVSKVAPLQIEEGLSSYLGATLLLNGKTSIRLYFSEAVIGSTQNGSRYYVEVADLGADDLKTVWIVKISDATYTFSALSFAKAVIEGDYGEEFQVLMKALVLYADAAEQL